MGLINVANPIILPKYQRVTSSEALIFVAKLGQVRFVTSSRQLSRRGSNSCWAALIANNFIRFISPRRRCCSFAVLLIFHLIGLSHFISLDIFKRKNTTKYKHKAEQSD